jgi:RimJ/RimL family protein N-acetyltransferase
VREPGEGPVYNIVGERVALGPLRRDLLPLYLRWLNDFEVMVSYGLRVRSMSGEAGQSWYDRLVRNERSAAFTVYELASGRPLGEADLRNIDELHRTAEFSIFIGEKDCWGRGYGTEATILVLSYAFTALSLHNVMLRVRRSNQRGIRAYTSAGFQLIGRRREAHRLAGAPDDVVFMDCLATEFRGPRLDRLIRSETPPVG